MSFVSFPMHGQLNTLDSIPAHRLPCSHGRSLFIFDTNKLFEINDYDFFQMSNIEMPDKHFNMALTENSIQYFNIFKSIQFAILKLINFLYYLFWKRDYFQFTVYTGWNFQNSKNALMK